MYTNKIFLLSFIFIMGCSCSATRENQNTEKPQEPPVENVKTEKDGVKHGEMQEVVSRPAMVESVKIYIKESFPMQVDVYASGNLPDGCTKIADIQKNLDGETFKVTIMTERPAHMVCTQALVPFEERFALDVVGLKAGTYIVNVNGVRETFTMPVDNQFPADDGN